MLDVRNQSEILDKKKIDQPHLNNSSNWLMQLVNSVSSVWDLELISNIVDTKL